MFESMDFASLLPTRQTTQEQAQEPEDDMCSLLPALTWTERKSFLRGEQDIAQKIPTVALTHSSSFVVFQTTIGLIGCGTCMVAGYLLSFGAFFRVKELIIGNPCEFE